jgi:hypothetical protein
MNRIVPKEVFKILESETESFRNYTTDYIATNYNLGVTDTICRFKGKDVQIIKGMEKYEEKLIVKARAQLIQTYITDAYELWPELIDSIDVTIPICWSDSSDNPLQKIPCLVFSKKAYSNNILMPSLNSLVGHWELRRVHHFDTPLYDKEDTLCFAGSMTGYSSGKTRLKLANMLPDGSYCKIIKPKMESDEWWAKIKADIEQNFPNIIEKQRLIETDERFPVEEQLKYKYQLCVDGHTAAWARLPWQMASNTVPIKVRNPKSDNIEWFYNLLKPNKHFLEVDIDEIIPTYEYLKTDLDLQRYISESGKRFVSKYCGQELALKVLIQTLLLLNQKQDNSLIVRNEQEQSGTADPRKV